jgi:uncharacterized protein
LGSSSAALGLVLIAGLACGAARADCAPGRVELRGPDGPVAAFSVEIADTPALREQGLMFRDHLSPGAGMLFTYPAPDHVYYWMKNTLIPLDIVFADPSGRVSRVHANAIPQDLTPIDGGAGVAYVLEINGGLAARLGIVPGVELRAAAIDPAQAAWPCP